MSEADLIARAKEGDGAAFNELVERYQGALYNVAYRMLGNEQDAADATQDAFLSAYRSLGRYRGGSFSSWLLRIVTNASYDILRRAKRCPADSLDEGEEIDQHESLADPGETPEALVERRDLSRQVQYALATLPPTQRVVVVLVDLQGLSYAEAARILRVPVGTVRSRLSRGRRAVRDRMLPQIECTSSRQNGDEPTSAAMSVSRAMERMSAGQR